MYEAFFLRSGAAEAQPGTDLVVFSVPNCMVNFSWVEPGDHGGHFTHRHFSNFSIPILLFCTFLVLLHAASGLVSPLATMPSLSNPHVGHSEVVHLAFGALRTLGRPSFGSLLPHSFLLPSMHTVN